MKTTEVFTPVDTKVGLTTDGKILKFATLEDYEKAVDHEQEDLQTNMLAAIKSVKFKNYATLEQVNQPTTDKSKGQEMDEFLAQLLNVDGAVQIQDHIYKVDLAKEKVFVIKAEDRATHYQDLIHGNTSNKAVMEYSTDDDVLYAVRDGINEKCGDTGIGSDNKSTSLCCVDNLCNNSFQGEAKFNKYGIYFSLTFKCKKLAGDGLFMQIDLSKIYYKQKCGYTTGPYVVNGYGGHSSSFEYQSYSGSKNLNQVWFTGRVRGQKTINGQTLYVTSSWAEIRKNI